MAIVTYNTYIPDVVVYVPGCPHLTIVDALRKTAASFFYDSLAYRKWVTPFDLTINTTTYTISTMCPTDTEVAQVLALYCNGVAVTELTHDQFFAYDPEWPSKTGANAQYFSILDGKDTINTIPIPSAIDTGAMTMQLAVCPTLTSTGVEQVHFEEWKDQIIDGALARLLAMPGHVWTDVKMATERHGRYASGKAKARIQAEKGNTRRDTVVQQRRWV